MNGEADSNEEEEILRAGKYHPYRTLFRHSSLQPGHE
jgi:hypothetical protein